MEFLGFEVEGVGGTDKYKSNRPEQYSVEHFKVSVAAILAFPEVTGIAWTQYTPYFNDGEPCVFSVQEPYFAFQSVETSDEEYFDYGWMEDDYEENGRVWCGDYCNSSVFEKFVGKTEKLWGEWKPGGSYRDREWAWAEGSGPEASPNPALFNAIIEFERLLTGGHYDHTVEDLFGDHAVIKIDKLAGKVIVDEYSHD